MSSNVSAGATEDAELGWPISTLIAARPESVVVVCARPIGAATKRAAAHKMMCDFFITPSFGGKRARVIYASTQRWIHETWFGA
jgi:hypothetical protein